jgi:hypothetical protein
VSLMLHGITQFLPRSCTILRIVANFVARAFSVKQESRGKNRKIAEFHKKSKVDAVAVYN